VIDIEGNSVRFRAAPDDLHRKHPEIKPDCRFSEKRESPVYLLGEGHMYVVNVGPEILPLIQAAIEHGRRERSNEIACLIGRGRF
jgi:hypothetical protein